MENYQGTTGPLTTWEETYRTIPAGELPWNAGMVDGDLKDLLGTLGPGGAYDLGCGTGNDAAYLAQEGWDVTAVDISLSAVELAKETARQAGMEGKIRFLVADVLTLAKDGKAVLVHDRGCFHTLPSELWGDYLRMVSGLLVKGGLLALKVFSFKTPPGPGPYRFTVEELRKTFAGPFEMTAVKEGVFHGPRKPYSLFGLFKKI